MLRIVHLPVLLLFVFGCNPSQSPKQSDKTENIQANSQAHAFTTDYLRGSFDPTMHADFVIIDSIYADRAGLYLRKDAYAAYLKMHAAAKTRGINLVIRSATRNFMYQKGIWERKWTGETKIENGKDASIAYPDPTERALAILRYSSMPGTSRHHWGTDIDLNSFDNSWFEDGEGLALYGWLVENGPNFGFCQPYTPKGATRPYGYEEEKWHWSYFPVSAELTTLAQSALSNDMISGFNGSETATEIDVVMKYVLGVNPACK